MKPGDMVRFRREVWPRKRDTDCGMWEWKLGLLVEYHTWEKVATILCEGKIIRIRAADVMKAGKKDYEKR
jgi:hypothetical protein